MAYGYSALRTSRPMPGDPLSEDAYGTLPLHTADNTTTQGAFEQQNALRRAGEEAQRPVPAAAPAPMQPVPQPQSAPYVSPFGTPPMSDEQYRSLPKMIGPRQDPQRSALDYELLAQGDKPLPEMVGMGGAERAGSAIRSRRSQLDDLEAEGLSLPNPGIPLPKQGIKPAVPKPSLWETLFGAKKKTV